MRWLAAVAIAIAIVMVVVSIEHDSVVPMPVSITDPNSDAADPDLDALRDDHWLVAGIQRTGKCRHRQERNKKQGKYSILHGTLFGWGHFTSRCPPECALGTPEVCIGLTMTALEAPMKERGLAGACPIKVRSSCPPDPKRQTCSHDVSNFAQLSLCERSMWSGQIEYRSHSACRMDQRLLRLALIPDLRLIAQNDIQ
jgi:hypothetical protein